MIQPCAPKTHPRREAQVAVPLVGELQRDVPRPEARKVELTGPALLLLLLLLLRLLVLWLRLLRLWLRLLVCLGPPLAHAGQGLLYERCSDGRERVAPIAFSTRESARAETIHSPHHNATAFYHVPAPSPRAWMNRTTRCSSSIEQPARTLVAGVVAVAVSKPAKASEWFVDGSIPSSRPNHLAAAASSSCLLLWWRCKSE